MTYIAKTAFAPLVSNREYSAIDNVAGIFQTSGSDDVASAGFLCIRTGRLDNEGYASYGLKDHNAWYFQACTASAAAVGEVFACNTYDINYVVDADGNEYPVSAKTLGLPSISGKRCTYTKISFDNISQYRFGEGNFSALPTSGQVYATIANGLLTPTSSKPSSGVYFSIFDSGNFTEGAYCSYGYYDVQACVAASAASAPAAPVVTTIGGSAAVTPYIATADTTVFAGTCDSAATSVIPYKDGVAQEAVTPSSGTFSYTCGTASGTDGVITFTQVVGGLTSPMSAFWRVTRS